MITIEAINQINQQYLERMNEIEAMKVQESRSAKFARNAGELLLDKAVIVHCPNEECVNGYTPKQHDCWAHGYSDEGCPECNWLGYTAPMCEECKGQGEVLMYPDGHVEALV